MRRLLLLAFAAVCCIRTESVVAQAGDPVPVEPISFKHAGVTDAWAAYAGKLTFGKGQTLALLDDGCKVSMPEWSQSDGATPKILVAYNSVDGNDDPKHVGRGYHGSTIGIPSSLNYKGKRGVAFNNQLAVVRALECCHCNVKDSKTLAAGLQWVIDNHAKYHITAVNLAPVDDLEHGAPVPTEIDAKLKRLRELGIWVSAPAGNHNFTKGISWPACQPHCFAIGAVRPGKDQVYLDRSAKIDLVVPAAATSSSNAILCGSVLLLREAIDKAGYDWKKDGPTLPDAMMAIFQRTGVAVIDPGTKLTFRRLDVKAALDNVFQAVAQPQTSAETPVIVAASPKAGGHIHPSICRAKDGTLIVVYKGPQVLMRARSTDGGKTWEAPEAIATSAKRPDVIREVKVFEVYPGTADTLPDGRIVVTWNYIADDKAKDRYYERALLYTLSTDQGRTWSEQQLIGPIAGKHLGAVRHNVLPWSEDRWLLPLRDGPPRVFDPKKGELTVLSVKGANDKQHSFQQIIRTAKGTLLAMGPVFLRSTDEGKTWASIANFPADAQPIDSAEGRYLTALSDGRVVVTWGVGTANKGLRYNFSSDDGQTWNQKPVMLLPETNIAARYYSARTIQVDDQHIGTVYLSGSTVYFLKVRMDRVAKAH